MGTHDRLVVKSHFMVIQCTCVQIPRNSKKFWMGSPVRESKCAIRSEVEWSLPLHVEWRSFLRVLTAHHGRILFLGLAGLRGKNIKYSINKRHYLLLRCCADRLPSFNGRTLFVLHLQFPVPTLSVYCIPNHLHVRFMAALDAYTSTRREYDIWSTPGASFSKKKKTKKT